MASSGTLGPSKEGGRAHSPDFCSFSFFKTSIRTCLASAFSWLLTTFSLFDLLNVCFSSVFHTCSDSLPFPQAPGHLPSGDIKCDVRCSFGSISAASSLSLLPPPPSFLPRMQMPRQWRGWAERPFPCKYLFWKFYPKVEDLV